MGILGRWKEGSVLSRKSASKKKTSPRTARRGFADGRYFVVRVLSVSVRVAEPAGVSTRVVEVDRDFSVVVSGFEASMFTLVDELDGGAALVDEELEAAGAEGAGCTTVVEELDAGGASLGTGSFTTVVEEVLPVPGRSHPARATMATAAMGSRKDLIEVSVLEVGTS
jgi:hypothetical protein